MFDLAVADCGFLSNPLNGQVVFTATTQGSIASYSCNDGFSLNGDPTRVCQSTAQWSGTEPMCQSECH